ncbi:hypothetical protein N9937_00180 [bacterium]|nr:hypothetical protein [bacterium]
MAPTLTRSRNTDMSIFRKDTVVKSYPALDIVEREPMHNGFINIVPEDVLYCGTSRYKASSVMSYAAENNECPLEAYERCKRHMVEFPYNGHKVYWINALSVSICSNPQHKGQAVKVEIGTKVKFQGKYFEITAENNNNLGLKEINLK